MELLDRYRGTIYGLAAGDALGRPTEFMDLDAIEAAYGPTGIRELPEPALFTDDTQMTLALAEAFLEAGAPDDPLAVMPVLARHFVTWSQSPDNTREPGKTCMAACNNLALGMPWQESGILDSKGCGAAMRTSPIGLLYADRELIRTMAYQQSAVTHGHPASLAATHAAALAVRLLIEGTSPADLVAGLAPSRGHSSDWDALLDAVPLALAATLTGQVTPRQVQQKGSEPWHLGESWFADEAVASALYCFLLAYARSQGYHETVCYGANTKGDSDSIACIAGAFAGAHWGVESLPEGWTTQLERADELGRLAERLHTARRG
jgi:ADP-ribosylglycohydrolase